MFNTGEFWYRTYSETIEYTERINKEEIVKDSLVIFIHVEKEDEEKAGEITKKAVDNIAWLARKTSRNKIVLHSFAHLSNSKSSVEFAQKMLETIQDGLKGKGYEVAITPFGYFLEFRIHVMGESLAKVWKAL
jgi:predicted urease superfamily metal-dependent hydrolase